MKSLARSGIALALVLLLGSCMPASAGQTSNQPPASTPTVISTFVSEATATQTVAAVIASSTPAPTSTIAPTPTFTPIPTFTATGNPIGTDTPSAAVTVGLTSVPGESVSIQKLPPNTVYGLIAINNNSGTEADVSLHCTTLHGFQTIIEYNNVKHPILQAPQGYYVVVVYVGGKMLSRSFTFLTQSKISITIYRDRLVIQ